MAKVSVNLDDDLDCDDSVHKLKELFRTGQITCIFVACPVMLPSGEFSPSHEGLRSTLQPNRFTIY